MAAAARLEEFNPLDMASEGLRIIGMELLSVMMCCKVDNIVCRRFQGKE